jgi:tRNA-2-methylthio-N6-dimethylallyladenosine synthase
LHLPVQSGSDRILGMMKRNYTRAQYLDKIRRVRAARPDISLSSDFIIGFPSETEDDFMQTMDLIAEARFDCAYSFVYSPRPGTPAANLRDNVTLEEKQRRLHLLQNRIRQLDDEFKQGLVGTTQTILVEKHSVRGQGRIAGRTSCNRMVNVEGPGTLIGQFVDVLITETQPNSLRGRLLQ